MVLSSWSVSRSKWNSKLILALNSCPPYGSSLAEAWDPSRILPLKQRTGGVVPEVLNRPAMGCDPFGIRKPSGSHEPPAEVRGYGFPRIGNVR